MLRHLVISALLCATALPQAQAARKYRIRVRTTPPGAAVYVQTREGGVRGTTPHRLYLPRGRHLIILEVPGFDPLEQVIDVRRSDTFTFTLTKKIPGATLLVLTADPQQVGGTTLLVDGKPQGSLGGNLTLKPGRYLVGVTKPGHKLWQQWVTLKSGEQRTLSATLVPEGPKTGTLLVSSNVPGARVFVDGKSVGQSPALVHDIPVGEHAVEIHAKGYPHKSATARVEANKTARLSIAHEIAKAPPKRTGTLRLMASQPAVDIYLDGEFRGKAPLTLKDVPQGTHIVVAQLGGHKTVEKRVVITGAQVTTIKLSLPKGAVGAAAPATLPTAAGIPTGTLVVRAQAGATVLLDGRSLGTVPVTKTDVTAGSHLVRIELPGHEPVLRQLDVPPGQQVHLNVDLRPQVQRAASQPADVPPDLEASNRPLRVRGQSSYGAQLVAPRNFTADVSAGWPYYVEGRLTTGVFSAEHFGLDAGVELRTYGTVTEFNAIGKFRFVYMDPLAVAAMLSMGGGGGPGQRNTFFMNIGAVASILFKRILTFTGRVYVNMYTDRLCPTSAEDGEIDGCHTPPADLDADQNTRDRFGGVRVMLSGILELPITTHIGAFLLVEGAPFQSGRHAFTSPFASLMPDSDPNIYGRLGATFKF